MGWTRWGSLEQVEGLKKSKGACGKVRDFSGFSLHLAHSLPWTEKKCLLHGTLENTDDK